MESRADKLIRYLRNEIDHASFNNHIVTGQGIYTPVPGVRTDYIEACIERTERPPLLFNEVAEFLVSLPRSIAPGGESIKYTQQLMNIINNHIDGLES
jgi:hypothetical protein